MPYSISDEHTGGDVALILSGETLEILFADAAPGLTEIMIESTPLDSRRILDISLESETLEELLFDWLAELIYLKDAEKFLPKRAEILKLDPDKFRIEAKLFGDTLDPKRYPVKVDIKAVTYYRFKLVYEKNEWSAEVVLDL